MTRWVPLPFLALMWHTAPSLPMAAPMIVNTAPLAMFSQSVQRDTLVVREARRHGVPVWLALSVSHAENWTGDSMAVNTWSGAAGLGQIHPVNFGRFPDCGENIYNRRTNLCYMMRILTLCKAETLAKVLNCYGGAESLRGKRAYNLDVNRRMKLEWLDDVHALVLEAPETL